MLSEEQNELLTITRRGTPLGEVFRRYWLPVGISEEITPGGKPQHVRIMGEDLVLFRDRENRPGLLGLHCSHRLAPLTYGRVEDGGIRCPFHGWVYDVEGRCLEQPAEPESANYKDKIRHPAYPCEDSGGLIFAYMGPIEKKPILPRYEVLVRKDGSRQSNYYKMNSNYLQNLEGAIDTSHAAYLHVEDWSKVKSRLASLLKPQIDFAETDYGIWQKSNLPEPNWGSMHLVYSYFIMPTGFMRVQESRNEKGLFQKFQSWFVPIDDTHTLRFLVGFAPFGKNDKPYEWPLKKDFIQPGPENEYFRNYDEIDTISGIPTRAGRLEVKGFLAQDNMVNEMQGPIVDRTKEHLATVDRVVVVVRKMLLKAIEDLKYGQDLKHIIRDPTKNETIYIRGDDEIELI